MGGWGGSRLGRAERPLGRVEHRQVGQGPGLGVGVA